MASEPPGGQDTFPILVPLGESDLTADVEQDIRGWRALDSAGDEIGTVDDLLIDREQRAVRMVRLREGGILGFGERHFLVPVEAIAEVGDDWVRVSRSAAEVAGSPAYQPDLVERPDDLYTYYGHLPFWVPGYVYPVWEPEVQRAPDADADAAASDQEAATPSSGDNQNEGG
jgi:sporulation protein YlmC with PRC-barrel domain